jgi:GNAT superfamily N-acetyltransferase
MNVKQIDAKDTYKIRNSMLREGFDESTCKFKGDNDDLTFHLGAFIDNKLASVASFYLHQHENFLQSYQYQLRGMATLPEFQKQGLSSALLKTAFPLIKRNNVDILWCNARTEAIGFYEKVGFETIGAEFDIATVGPHFLMSKDI